LKHITAEKGWLLKFGVAGFFLFGLLFLLWSCGTKNPVETEKVGSIFVYSNIPGATIELDDKPTGEQTPHTFENIEVGSHKVLVTKEGYNSTPEFETVKVEEGKEDTVEFTLTLISKVGAIWVNSDPQGAQIILDQVNTENITPYTLDSVPVGEHIVSVKMPGFLPSPAESLVTVHENDTSSAEFEFSLDTLHGSLSVSSNPSGATIVIDNQSTDKTTPQLFFSEIPIGTHVVSAFKEAHSNDDPAKKMVNVAAGDTINVTFNLSPASVGPDTEGQLAPDFELLDDSSKLIRLYNYRGCVVIVMFWATSCPLCMLELPFLEKLYDQYSIDDTLMIFAVNYEDDLGIIQREKTDNDLTYHLLVGKESQMLEDYDILGPGTPVTIIIARSGLIYSWVRGYNGENSSEAKEMRTALSELFGH